MSTIVGGYSSFGITPSGSAGGPSSTVPPVPPVLEEVVVAVDAPPALVEGPAPAVVTPSVPVVPPEPSVVALEVSPPVVVPPTAVLGVPSLLDDGPAPSVEAPIAPVVAPLLVTVSEPAALDGLAPAGSGSLEHAATPNANTARVPCAVNVVALLMVSSPRESNRLMAAPSASSSARSIERARGTPIVVPNTSHL